MSSISRFHIQIIQLFAFVFVWVHWDACLQYGACASQPPSRYTHTLSHNDLTHHLSGGWRQRMGHACLHAHTVSVTGFRGSREALRARSCVSVPQQLLGVCKRVEGQGHT